MALSRAAHAQPVSFLLGVASPFGVNLEERNLNHLHLYSHLMPGLGNIMMLSEGRAGIDSLYSLKEGQYHQEFKSAVESA